MDQQSDVSSIPEATRSVKGRRRRKQRGRYTGSARFREELAALRVEGRSQRKAGRALGVNQSTISRVENRPEVKARIVELRTAWTFTTQMRIAEVVTGVMDMLGEAIANRDAQAMEAISRGLLALEKISSSAAEVRQRVDVSGIPPSVPTKADIKALLAVMFPEKHSPDIASESSQ